MCLRRGMKTQHTRGQGGTFNAFTSRALPRNESGSVRTAMGQTPRGKFRARRWCLHPTLYSSCSITARYLQPDAHAKPLLPGKAARELLQLRAVTSKLPASAARAMSTCWPYGFHRRKEDRLLASQSHAHTRTRVPDHLASSPANAPPSALVQGRLGRSLPSSSTHPMPTR